MSVSRPIRVAATIAALLMAFIMPVVAQDAPATTDAPGTVTRVVKEQPVRIGSRWIASTFLNNEGGKLQNTTILLEWVSPMWLIENMDGGKVRIHSVWQPDAYLNIEGGSLTAGPIQPDWQSAQWVMEPVGRGFYVRIRSAWKPDIYVNVAKGELQATPIAADSLSADWWLLK